MFKKLFITISAGSMALFLITACAEETNESTAMESSLDTGHQDASIMNQPVDFSSPEAVEKTLQNIRETEGDKAYNRLESTMQYMLVYDLSVGHNEEKLHKKLHGMTPEEILSSRRR